MGVACAAQAYIFKGFGNTHGENWEVVNIWVETTDGGVTLGHLCQCLSAYIRVKDSTKAQSIFAVAKTRAGKFCTRHTLHSFDPTQKEA